MAIVHVNLTEDSKCGFCGTPVKAGYSVCPNCGAMHGYEKKEKDGCLTSALVFFIAFGCLTVITNVYPRISFSSLGVIIAIIIIVTIGIFRNIQKKAENDIAWWK